LDVVVRAGRWVVGPGFVHWLGAGAVGVVARLERAGEELVLVTLELVGTLGALDLRPDALLLRRGEAARRDLLALVHVRRRDVLRKLVRAGDRARDNGLPRHGLLLQHVLIDDVRPRRTRPDVARRRKHRHPSLPPPRRAP